MNVSFLVYNIPCICCIVAATILAIQQPTRDFWGWFLLLAYLLFTWPKG